MMNPPHPYWSKEEDRRLRILWEAGWTANAIAQDIGRSRNAVLGRRFRLGLPERESPIPVNEGGNGTAQRSKQERLGIAAARDAINRWAA